MVIVFFLFFLWMNVGSKHWTTFSLAHLHSFKTQSQVLKKKRKKNWTVVLGCWTWHGEERDSWCWPGAVVLSYPSSSSTHSLTPEAWVVCCRGLHLLLSAMSEHMQLSLALCRIGLYTVRRCKHAGICLLENSRDGVCVYVLDWTLLVLVCF